MVRPLDKWRRTGFDSYMDVELAEVRDFLAMHAPFDSLTREVLDGLPAQLSARYYRRGSVLVTAGRENNEMFVLRSGAIDIIDTHGSLVERSEVGTCFGMSAVISGGVSKYTMTAHEDSLVLVMPGKLFLDLMASQPAFSRFFMAQQAGRMRSAVEAVQVTDSGGAVLKTRVKDMLKREPICAPPDTPIREAARIMSERRISALLITIDGRLEGIVTDRDLRNKVVAINRDSTDPVSEIMTVDPVTMPLHSLAFECLLEMAQRGLHHLPVVDGDRVVGLVSAGDLMRLEQANPIYLVGDIAAQNDLAGLKSSAARLPSVVETYIAQDASADDINRVVTAIGDAITRKLINFAEAELGPPPVRYCWVALGSQARLEQGLQSDQDNAIIIDDSVTEADREWFAQLADRVCSGLVECGYPACPGDMMASNPKWRQPLRQWGLYFSGWINEPEPDALLNAQTFFDMRPLYGDNELFSRLQRSVVSWAPKANRFLAYLAKQTQQWTPPIGFFREFVLETEGEHKDTLDIKAGGIIAIVQMARLFTLSKGLTPVNTIARLKAAAGASALTEENAQDLADAFEFITYMRLRHQVRQLRAGQEPDSHIKPAELTAFEKRHLREAFQIIRKMQNALAFIYQTHLTL